MLQRNNIDLAGLHFTVTTFQVAVMAYALCWRGRLQYGSPVLGDRNTGILVLCTILVYKFVPVLWFFFKILYNTGNGIPVM